MTTATSPEPHPARAWALPALVLLGLMLVLGGVIVLARRAAAPDTPPVLASLVTPSPVRPVGVYDVRQVNGNEVLLTGEGGATAAPLRLAPETRIEVLRPATAAELRAGDWLTVIGIPNEVRNFTIRTLVAIPEAGTLADGVRRSAGGFAGHEAARDRAERPLLGGEIERIEGSRLILRGPDGPITVDLTAAAPLRRLTPGTAAELRPGDRIALETPAAVLILPEGAR